MNTQEIIDCISEKRFASYEKIFNQIVPNSEETEEKDKIIFYRKIQELYSSFFFPIQIIEVTLRNKIHYAMQNYYGIDNWLTEFNNEDKAFMEKAQSMIKDSINYTHKDFTNKNYRRSITTDDYVSRITFGFWVEILKPNYRNSFKFWQFHINDVFPNRNNFKKTTLGEIYNNLVQIKNIRNRLYHHEPIWKFAKCKNLESFCEQIKKKFELILHTIELCSYEQKDTLLSNTQGEFEKKLEQFKKEYSKLGNNS